MSDVSWTEPVIAELTALWEAGGSAADIADALSRHFGVLVTRNAVLGKVHRLGLSGRKTLPKQGPPRTSKLYPDRIFKPYTRKPPMDFDNYQSPTVEVVPLKLSLMELTATTCRYPYGEPSDKDFFFCGNPVASESSYCSAHHRVCHATSSGERPHQRYWLRKHAATTKKQMLQSNVLNPIDIDERGEAA